MIVQELQRIQERVGWLPPEEMRALAQELTQRTGKFVPLHRIHEVASFYPLYRLKPPPRVDVKVCRDMACHLRGAADLREKLEAYGNELGSVEVGGVSCLGQCDRAVAVSINDHHIYRGLAEARLRECIRLAHEGKSLPHHHADRRPLGWQIDVYQGQSGFEALKQFLASGDPDALLKKLEVAQLRGMGGAGFPTHLKWKAVRGAPGKEKYVVCNADESEPGTFKDRELMRRTPWLLIEGIVLAALVVGAERGWIYIRHEYPEELAAMEQAIEEARSAGVVGDSILGSGRSFHLEMFVSPGGYIQGEESALLEAMEDRRGEPRNKPPFPVYNGLYNKPTVINNVETLSWVPAVAIRGGEWYRDAGVNGEPGLRFASVSGDVVNPGVFEVPFGLKVKELIFDAKYCGGLRPGRQLKALATSGPSGGFLPAKIKKANLPPAFVQEFLAGGAEEFDLLELPLGLNTVGGKMKHMLGAAHIVYDDTRDMVENALNCVTFFRNESCGKCVPCRTGSQKLVDIISSLMDHHYPRQGLPLIGELSEAMSLASICGLGQVASMPIATVLKHFPEEVERYLSANGKR
jgi:NADH:ubiquinone oxidoreductase subunit F (NADH-binding)/NADH:ubiquinone oxidoreductase subunit E